MDDSSLGVGRRPARVLFGREDAVVVGSGAASGIWAPTASIVGSGSASPGAFCDVGCESEGCENTSESGTDESGEEPPSPAFSCIAASTGLLMSFADRRCVGHAV